MAIDLVSKRTRREFREWLVGWTLRTIDDLFEAHDVEHITVAPEHLPSGQRRSLVEEYYASVRWDAPGNVRRVLNAYEEILESVEDTSEGKNNLVRCLLRDGYLVESNRIKPGKLHEQFAVVLRATDRIDLDHLEGYIERIRHSIDRDPELAIGSTKELLEATLKTILDECNADYERSDDIPKLLRAVQKELDLAPAGVEVSKKGGEIIRRVLSSIGMIVTGVGELRNLYGTGHGTGRRSGGISARHADLVVAVGTAACTFLLQTYENRQGSKAF